MLMPQTSGGRTREQDHSPNNVPILAPLFVLESPKQATLRLKMQKSALLDSLAFGPRSGPPL